MRLLVADINSEAFDLLQSSPMKVPQNITLNLIQGDLMQLGFKSGSIDYIRMDFTQNFIPRERQVELLQEQHRILSENGIFASVMDMVPRAGDFIEKMERLLLPSKGSTTDVWTSEVRGYSHFYLSPEFITDAAKKVGFNTTFVDEANLRSSHHVRGNKIGFVAYEKA